METEPPRGERGKREAQDDSNVIRLPRDWLGPREELVPFGPRADDEAADHDRVSAAAFWGEDSAAIQDPVQGPSASAAACGRPRRIRPHRGFARRVSYGRSRDEERATDRRSLRYAVCAVAAVAVGALAVVGNTIRSSAPRTEREAGSGGLAAVFAPALPRVLALVEREPRLARTPHRRRSIAHRARSAHRPAAHVVHYAPRTATVATARPAVGATYTTHVSTSTPSVSHVPTTSSSSGSGASSGGTGAGSSGGAAGPVGPGAPFGPGQMG